MSKDENKKKKDVKNNGKFLKESKAELKKVSWPKPRALVNDTVTVIVIVLIVALIVFVLDLAFLKLNENFVVRTEEKIINSTVVDNNANNANEANEGSTDSQENNEEDEESDESETVEETESSEAE